jgi:hypothetical protein
MKTVQSSKALSLEQIVGLFSIWLDRASWQRPSYREEWVEDRLAPLEGSTPEELLQRTSAWGQLMATGDDGGWVDFLPLIREEIEKLK